MTYTCKVRVLNQGIELQVRQGNRDTWQWSIGFFGGQTLQHGERSTIEEAQFSAESAFERRLEKAGLSRLAPKAYRWLDS